MDRKRESRLKKDLVIWFGTVGADSQPHSTLVWFTWDGESFLVYSLSGLKVRDIENNANVHLHLNSDPEGAQMIRASGVATIARRKRPADIDPVYRRKYSGLLKGMGYTWDQFAGQYYNEIRVKSVRFQ